MTRKLTLTMASVLTLGLVAGTAFAAPDAPAAGPKGHAQHLLRLDSDGNGTISRAEFDAPRLERLKAIDPDQDGVITLEEMKARMVAEAEKRAEAQFARLDLDKDGKISAAEGMMAGRGMGRGHGGDIFARLDRDKDGELSAAELEAARPFGGPRGKGPRPGGHERPHDHEGGHRHHHGEHKAD